MKKLSYIGCFALFLLISCGQEKTNPNAYNLDIPKEKLVNIMIDLSIAESASASYRIEDRDSVKNVYRYQIEQIHGVPIIKIDSTIQIIYKNTILNQEIQKIVLDSLKRLEERAKKLK